MKNDDFCINCMQHELAKDVFFWCNKCEKTHIYYKKPFYWLPDWVPHRIKKLLGEHPFAAGYVLGIGVECVLLNFVRIIRSLHGA